MCDSHVSGRQSTSNDDSAHQTPRQLSPSLTIGRRTSK